MRHYPEGGGFTVWPGIFLVTRVHNTGAAFGLFRNAAVFLIAVSWIGVFCLAWYVWPARKKGLLRREEIAVSLIIAGALGNLADRLFYGYVVDFLDFRIWPVFNLADASICIGVGLLALAFFGSGAHH